MRKTRNPKEKATSIICIFVFIFAIPLIVESPPAGGSETYGWAFTDLFQIKNTCKEWASQLISKESRQKACTQKKHLIEGTC